MKCNAPQSSSDPGNVHNVKHASSIIDFTVFILNHKFKRVSRTTENVSACRHLSKLMISVGLLTCMCLRALLNWSFMQCLSSEDVTVLKKTG